MGSLPFVGSVVIVVFVFVIITCKSCLVKKRDTYTGGNREDSYQSDIWECVGGRGYDNDRYMWRGRDRERERDWNEQDIVQI